MLGWELDKLLAETLDAMKAGGYYAAKTIKKGEGCWGLPLF